jgi:hypothetical protein
MEELSKHGKVGLAAMRSGMSPNTAAKYAGLGKFPSDLREPRDWRTRKDPFEQEWPEIAARLKEAPELEAKTLFEELIHRKPQSYEPGQLRSLQRRVKRWRAQEGPDKVIFFAQEHRPGEAAQTDFTWATQLGITIGGEPFAHMLCHVVLPCSNWEWATVCWSESMVALRRGVQSAMFRLGRVPQYHQTDNSTAATHDLRTGKRGFNEDYSALMRHLGMTPRTTEVGEKEQNGDVESLNGALKRRLEQHLIVRRSREFPDVETYEGWLQGVLEAANRLRQTKLQDELAVMTPLRVDRLAEYREWDVRVSSWSTVRVGYNAYSVPSRLCGEKLKARVYDDRIEMIYGGEPQLTVERLHGRNGHRINYRHVIGSLLKKPGAFARYRYRAELFPTLVFRRAYDALGAGLTSWKADVEYLRILHLAATTMESDVERALEVMLETSALPLAEHVTAMVAPPEPQQVPALAPLVVDLGAYDTLLEWREELAS